MRVSRTIQYSRDQKIFRAKRQETDSRWILLLRSKKIFGTRLRTNKSYGARSFSRLTILGRQGVIPRIIITNPNTTLTEKVGHFVSLMSFFTQVKKKSGRIWYTRKDCFSKRAVQ